MKAKTILYSLATDQYRGLCWLPFKFFLLLLSWVYGLAVRLIIKIRHSHPYRFDCKTISVGNITLGGTGKTILVEYIASYLSKKGLRVAILTRGYRIKGSGNLIDRNYLGDEPLMLSKKLPETKVVVDANRVRAAKYVLSNFKVDTLLLDDGLQQWHLKKDLEIVTIDSRCPFGNGHLIPRGILRQPLTSLAKTDIFVLTKTNLYPPSSDLMNLLQKLSPKALFVFSEHYAKDFLSLDKGGVVALDSLKDKVALLFSGIGDPESFERIIAALGIKVGFSFRFPDHYEYTGEDIGKIISEAKKRHAHVLITTEKDAMRLQGKDISFPTMILRIGLRIVKNEEEFLSRL